mgnify:CR=1 FL=1
MNDSKNIERGGKIYLPFTCRVCGNDFHAAKRALYCCGACKQQAYLARLNQPKNNGAEVDYSSELAELEKSKKTKLQ